MSSTEQVLMFIVGCGELIIITNEAEESYLLSPYVLVDAFQRAAAVDFPPEKF